LELTVLVRAETPSSETLMLRKSTGLLVFVCFVIIGCGDSQARTFALKSGAAQVCDPYRTLTLHVQADGHFALAHSVADSAHLRALLQNVLPPTPGPRVLLVDIPSTRAETTPWVVSAVEATGYEAYYLDQACVAKGGPWQATLELH
jgi:hypothetical protein